MHSPLQVLIRDLGRTPYQRVFAAMQAFTEQRDGQAADEIWLTEHEPVFTQGQAGRPQHALATGDIPLVQSDRGGQITYHGPGQIVAYLLFDLRRMGLSVRGLVAGMENAVIAVLDGCGVGAAARRDAPGVYVDGSKVAALGLRVRRGCSYHGLSFNIDMDLEPFQRIEPCGMAGLKVTQLKDLCGERDRDSVRRRLLKAFESVYPIKCRKLRSPAAWPV